jgi:hypothetical protein
MLFFSYPHVLCRSPRRQRTSVEMGVGSSKRSIHRSSMGSCFCAQQTYCKCTQTFCSKSTKIRDIARELGVAHVLEGSVRKSGNHLRIAVQLLRADNGYHVWSETYDRTMDDSFSIQDEIAGAVIKALKVTLLEGALARAGPTFNSEVYTKYLQARSLWNRGTPADNVKSMDYLKRALALDSTFAPTWALLAQAHSVAFSLYGTDSFPEARTEAHRAAEQALKLDPKLSDAHLAMSWVRFDLDWDWDAADGEIRQALALNPFVWLDRAYRQHERSLVYAKWWFDELRFDPRYKAFLRKMNLPE